MGEASQQAAGQRARILGSLLLDVFQRGDLTDNEEDCILSGESDDEDGRAVVQMVGGLPDDDREYPGEEEHPLPLFPEAPARQELPPPPPPPTE